MLSSYVLLELWGLLLLLYRVNFAGEKLLFKRAFGVLV